MAEDDTGEELALKITGKPSKGKKSNKWNLFENEVDALKRCFHPNIVNMLNYSDGSQAVKSDGSKLDVIYIALEN